MAYENGKICCKGAQRSKLGHGTANISCKMLWNGHLRDSQAGLIPLPIRAVKIVGIGKIYRQDYCETICTVYDKE
jgi:hypothetical protein